MATQSVPLKPDLELASPALSPAPLSSTQGLPLPGGPCPWRGPQLLIRGPWRSGAMVVTRWLGLALLTAPTPPRVTCGPQSRDPGSPACTSGPSLSGCDRARPCTRL